MREDYYTIFGKSDNKKRPKGVSISYEGTLKSSESYNELVNFLVEFANRNEFALKVYRDTQCHLNRWNNFGEIIDRYEGESKGIMIFLSNNYESDFPLNFEFDDRLYLSESIETQNLTLDNHILITEILQKVSCFFETFSVEDSGGYWLKKNIDLLFAKTVNHFIFEKLNELRQLQCVEFISNIQLKEDYSSEYNSLKNTFETLNTDELNIYVNGKLKSNLEYELFAKNLKDYAKVKNYSYEQFEKSRTYLYRTYLEENWVEAFHFYNYLGSSKGLLLYFDKEKKCNQSIHFEFDNQLILQDTLLNSFETSILAHIEIIHILKHVENHFENLIVNDDCNYWETNDIEQLFNNTVTKYKAKKLKEINTNSPQNSDFFQTYF
jgi:hypothetical protein